MNSMGVCIMVACLCFDGTNNHPYHSERKMNDVYEATIKRKGRLWALGFTVKTIWEHDYRKLRSTDEMQLFLDTCDIKTDLDPRDRVAGDPAAGLVVINYFVKQNLIKNQVC